MARIINNSFLQDSRTLTAQQRKAATAKLRATQSENRLRRVRLACDAHATRDPLAQLGDHVWCDTHGDWGQVVDVTE